MLTIAEANTSKHVRNAEMTIFDIDADGGNALRRIWSLSGPPGRPRRHRIGQRPNRTLTYVPLPRSSSYHANQLRQIAVTGAH